MKEGEGAKYSTFILNSSKSKSSGSKSSGSKSSESKSSGSISSSSKLSSSKTSGSKSSKATDDRLAKKSKSEKSGKKSEHKPTELQRNKDKEARADVPKPAVNAWEDLFNEALVLYQKGVNGDAEAVNKALSILQRVRGMAPDNNLVKAYYGGSVVLKGRDAANSTDKFSQVMNGLKILDECVAAEPSTPEIRLLTGFVNRRLPELYFHRTVNAVEDFAYLAAEYEKDNSILPKDLYWRTLYEWGAACKKLERYADAQKAWNKLLEETEDDHYKELLKRERKVFSRQYETDDHKPKEQFKKRWGKEIPADGLDLYEKALGGDKEAALQAYEIFSKAYEEKKRNPLVQAYYADSLSMVGKYKPDIPEMISYTIKAMKLYDSLLADYPENVRLRLMRAYHSYRLPETFFHRSVTAINDFNDLIGKYEADPSLFPEQVYWQMLFDLGSSYFRMGMKQEARDVWTKLLEVSQDPQFKELVDAQPTDEIPDYSGLTKEELYEEGKRLFDQGIAGNKRAAIFARECWRTASNAYPADSLALAYYGSSLALSARHGVEPEHIFRTAYHGLNLLNEAVEQSPDDTEVRTLRAYVLKALPRPFFPSHTAVEDFKVLLDAYERGEKEFSWPQYEKLRKDMKEVSEGSSDPLGSSAERISPITRQLLAGKVINL